MTTPSDDAPVVHVGCPMWAHRPWVGRYFPADTGTGRELEAYAHWCSSVEGNTTFYALPTESTITTWAEQTPAWFRFCFKLGRDITHDRRLRNTGGLLSATLDRFAPLRANLGPLQIQLPGTFGPDDLGVLDTFLDGCSREWAWAVEVRHPDFEAGGPAERPLNDLLAHHGVDRVLLDSRALFAVPPTTPEAREAWERKPRLRIRPVATGTQPIVRLIGADDPEPLDPILESWVPKIVTWVAAGITPHVFIHTPSNDDGPADARATHARIAAAVRDELGVELAPLPDPGPYRAATQTDLFG